MNRRDFLKRATVATAVVVASTPSTKASLWSAFFRWVRQSRVAQRTGDLSRLLRNVYAEYRVNAFPVLTPLLANVKRSRLLSLQHAKPVIWDVVIDRPRPLALA